MLNLKAKGPALPPARDKFINQDSIAVATPPFAATTTTFTAAATGSRWTLLAGARDIYSQGTTLKILAVEHFDRLVRFLR